MSGEVLLGGNRGKGNAPPTPPPPPQLAHCSPKLYCVAPLKYIHLSYKLKKVHQPFYETFGPPSQFLNPRSTFGTLMLHTISPANLNFLSNDS